MYRSYLNGLKLSEIPDLDIIVDFDNPAQGIREVVKRLKPDWDVSKVEYENKSTGFLNKNYKVFCPGTNDAFLLRTMRFENNKELPTLQKAIHKFIHLENLGPKMYCTVTNGVCIEFLQGKTMTWDTRKGIYDSNVWPQTAEVLASYHCKSRFKKAKNYGLLHRDDPCLDGFFVQSVNALKGLNPDSDFSKSVPCGEELLAERAWYVRLADRLTPGRRVVHLDPNPTNWMVDKDGQVTLIDYDMLSVFYPSADVAWFFLLHCDLRKLDLDQYPSHEHRQRWLRRYLTRRRKLDGERAKVTEQEVDAAQEQVRVGLLFAYLQVVLGAMIMRLMYLMTGQGEVDEQTVTVCWRAYKTLKAEFVKQGY